MSFAVSLSPSFFSLTLKPQLDFRISPKLHSFPKNFPLQASRRSSSFSEVNDCFVEDPRNWTRAITREFVDYDDDEDDEDEEEDRSLDLLVKFVENMFKKVSKRARKAVRSVLPVAISKNLVGFSVNGVLILAFLWVLKAFLEVVCALGSVVFVSILLIRGVWTGITYLQETRSHRVEDMDDGYHAWRGQPAG